MSSPNHLHGLLLALLAGCTGRSPADSDDDTDPDAGCHPLVPPEYCFLWNTDEPCQRQGLPGRRIYRVAEGGRALADNTFEILERWYWFKGDPARPEQDVVDTIRYRGSITTRWTPERMMCGDCEVVVEATAEIVENPSGWSYADEVGSVFAFDTLNANGGFNEDYRTRMTKGVLTERGEPQVDWPAYARGQWRPDNDTPGGLPASVSWGPADFVGECY